MATHGMRRVLRVAWDAWWVEHADGDAIARRQQARLAELVRHARSASPYYRRLYRGLPAHVTDPRLLPPVGKRDLMEHFDEWVTDPDITLEGLRRDFLSDLALVGSPYLGRYHVFTTSGTTGEPTVLVHDADSWVVLHVVARLRARRALVSENFVRDLFSVGLRSAGLFVTGGHFGAVVLAENTRRNRFMARRVRVFSVLEPVSDLVQELNDFRPTVISGYPSAIVLLAEEQKAGRLRISPFLAMTSGETLTAAGRQEVETAFGCRIVEGYAASEVPALSVQCPDGRFHVNADWYLCEPVDEDYEPVPAGVTSHTVLVTNLANHVQPVIRYDLGDRVELAAAPCPCGSVLPTVKVEGRTSDVLSFESTDGGAAKVLPLALGTVIEETPGVHRFQAIRTGPTTLTVRLEFSSGADPAEVWSAMDDRVRRFLRTQGTGPVTIEHDQALPAADPRSGKFRQVWTAS